MYVIILSHAIHTNIPSFNFRFLNFIVFLLRNLFRNIEECSKPPEVKEADGSIIKMQANGRVILESNCFIQHVITNLITGVRVYKVDQKERQKWEGGEGGR